MEMHKPFISYVIQSGNQHVQHSEVVNLPAPRAAIYTDKTSKEVLKGSLEKLKTLPKSKKLIVLNYSNIINVNYIIKQFSRRGIEVF